MESGLRSSVIIASALALVLGVPRSVEALAPAKRGSYERTMAEAGALVDEGKHGEAVERFTVAFAAMPADVKVGDVGEFVVYSGAEAAIRQFEIDGDAAVLERGKELVITFLAAVDGVKPGTSVASVERTKAMLAEIERLLNPAPEPIPEPIPEPVPEPATPATADVVERDRVALALVVSGSLSMVGGLALIIAGARQVPWYEGRLEHFGWEPGSPDYDYQAKLDEARRIRNIDMGVGAGVTAVGAGLLVYGAVRMARHGTAHRRVALRPYELRRGAGLSLTGRF